MWWKKKMNCFYDKTKGRAVVGMVIGKHTTRRWTMNAFAYMLDTAHSNTHTVFKKIKHDIHNFDFI